MQSGITGNPELVPRHATEVSEKVALLAGPGLPRLGKGTWMVRRIMGHSKIQTTFDVYGHLLPGSHDEVRERMDGYLLDAPEEAVESAEDAV